MEQFANAGGMLPEQLWDGDDLPEGKMKRGDPTGAAMPLCRSHAEYLTLVRSSGDGVCFDRIVFTFLRRERWEGKDFQVEIVASHRPHKRDDQGRQAAGAATL